MFYATQDNDGLKIRENAHIERFERVSDAISWLLKPYAADEWNHASAEIEPGNWGDCWIKHLASIPKRLDLSIIKPLAFNQVNVQPPGKHPGGAYYWVTPAVDVYIVSNIAEKE